MVLTNIDLVPVIRHVVIDYGILVNVDWKIPRSMYPLNAPYFASTMLCINTNTAHRFDGLKKIVVRSQEIKI